ncbi:cytochrome P450 [Phanerochaete sordida]|uniref:Cytochrome P450 n=1 Tax=Phanerochaete sordida TaxID=48140 RepID=A0A9P3GTB7_9APHY|nr:cytochrome P450 [Phanerochaete sordida]
MHSPSPLVLVAACLGLYIVSLIFRRPRRLPPGPRTLPIVGNLFNVPKSLEWLEYQEWARQHGSAVVHYQILGTHYVILNTAKAATDLFERRSQIYSDKDERAMIHLSGWGRNWGLMKYGDYWRAHRRLFHQYFRSTAVQAYHTSSKRAIHQLLYALRDSPARFWEHVRLMAGSNILRIMYAVDVQADNDPNLALVKKAIQVVQKVGAPGTYTVDSFPILQNIPEWFPGAQFKRQAAQWRPFVEEMYIRPFRDVKEALDSGEPKPCVLSDMLTNIAQDQEGRDRAMLETVAINTTGTAYAAASDTTTCALLTIILAMLLYPDVQRAAQKELSDTLGRGRLPDMKDQASLPFITAILKESLRWRPPLPLGVAHKSTADDEYEGYFIPAGSVVIGNAWAMLHDDERYPDPDTFDPRRFLDGDGKLRKDVPDPVQAFGYGRRVCPGRYFAMDVLWLAVASLLSAHGVLHREAC